MGLFDTLKDLLGSDNDRDTSRGVISNGPQKADGGHDHRYNRGNDRTPAQQKGDKNRSKD